MDLDVDVEVEVDVDVDVDVDVGSPVLNLRRLVRDVRARRVALVIVFYSAAPTAVTAILRPRRVTSACIKINVKLVI